METIRSAYSGRVVNGSSLVVLYGSSLLLAGLETCLRGLSGLSVVRIDHTQSDRQDVLRELQPDAIIFDSNDGALPDWPNLMQLLRDHPRALIISMAANHNDLLVLSSEQRIATDLADVIAAIRLAAGSSGAG